MWEENSKLQVTQSTVQWWLQTKSVRPFGKIKPVKLKITSFWKNCIRNTLFLLFHSRTHPPQNDASVTVDLLSRRGDESEKCLVNFPKSKVVIWILSVLDFVNFSSGLLCHWSNDDKRKRPARPVANSSNPNNITITPTMHALYSIQIRNEQ